MNPHGGIPFQTAAFPTHNFFFRAEYVKQMVNACSRASTVFQWMFKYVWACVCIDVSVHILVYISTSVSESVYACFSACICVCSRVCVCSGLCHCHALPTGTSCKTKPSLKHWASAWSSSASVCCDNSPGPHLTPCHQTVAASVFATL